MFFGGNNHFFSFETEELFTKFYKLLKKVKLSKANDNEQIIFKELINELLRKDEEIQVIISRELKQMERQIGKTFEL